MAGDLKFVVFDCDGTLVDSAHIIVATMEAAWEREGLKPPDASDVRHQVGLPLVEAIANLHPEGEPHLHHRLADHYRDAFHEDRMKSLHSEQMYPGCRDVLQELADAGMILGVATGKGPQGLLNSLESNGIREFFTILKTANDGPGKPNPDILIDAMNEVGVGPENTVMVGDTIFDITMAVRAKAYGIGVDWGYHSREALTQAGACDIAKTFSDLPGQLQKIWSVIR